MDTKLDPVRIVAAAPTEDMLTKGKGLGGRKLVVASEYEGICRAWIEKKGLDVSAQAPSRVLRGRPPRYAPGAGAAVLPVTCGILHPCTVSHLAGGIPPRIRRHRVPAP